MITIYTQGDKKLVDSLELYKKAGYAPQKYNRWLQMHIYNYAQKEIDYFDYQDIKNRPLRKSGDQDMRFRAPRYLITIEMAITVCLIAKTESAKRLKIWLQNNKNK